MTGLRLLTLATLLASGALTHATNAAIAQTAAPPGNVGRPAANKVDEFALPPGGAKELLEFVERLRQRKVEAATEEEYVALLRKTATAMSAAADKILAEKDLADADRVRALTCQLQAAALLAQLKDEPSQLRLKALVVAAKSHADKSLAALGRTYAVQALLTQAETGDATQIPALVTEVKSLLADSPANANLVRTGLSVAAALESLGEYPAALEVYGSLKETAARSGLPALADAVEQLGGVSIKRIGLVGKLLQLDGTTVEGKSFDIAQYKGKVVLVDFWATWCPPCVAEMPNIQANYEKWHAKGFEVVGVSMDEDRRELERFLAEEKLPWSTLYSDNSKQNSALAEKFGVATLPTAMLLGRDGKVITLKVRGAELGKQLERLLGAQPLPAEKAN